MGQGQGQGECPKLPHLELSVIIIIHQEELSFSLPLPPTSQCLCHPHSRPAQQPQPLGAESEPAVSLWVQCSQLSSTSPPRSQTEGGHPHTKLHPSISPGETGNSSEVLLWMSYCMEKGPSLEKMILMRRKGLQAETVSALALLPPLRKTSFVTSTT